MAMAPWPANRANTKEAFISTANKDGEEKSLRTEMHIRGSSSMDSLIKKGHMFGPTVLSMKANFRKDLEPAGAASPRPMVPSILEVS